MDTPGRSARPSSAASDADRPVRSNGNETAAPRPLNPWLLPLLDLLAELIARDRADLHGAALGGDRRLGVADHPASPQASARCPEELGNPGPVPRVPADSQKPSHPSSTRPARRTRRRTPTTKEAPDASD